VTLLQRNRDALHELNVRHSRRNHDWDLKASSDSDCRIGQCRLQGSMCRLKYVLPATYESIIRAISRHLSPRRCDSGQSQLSRIRAYADVGMRSAYDASLSRRKRG
jgi:hypothetical protein